MTARSSPTNRRLQALALLVLAASIPFARATPPPVEAFFTPPSMSQPVLSPDGQHLALRMASKEGRIQLAVLNLVPPRQLRLVAGFADADVREAHWVNNDRLVFTIDDFQVALRDRESPGLFAVDRQADGSAEQVRMLIQRGFGRLRVSSDQGRLMPAYVRFAGTLRDGSDDVLVFNPARARDNLAEAVLRQNTRTGRTSPIDSGPRLPGAVSWRMDAQGRARWAVARQEDVYSFHWRERADGPWREVLSRQTLATFASGTQGEAQHGPDGRLYVNVGRPGDPDGLSAWHRLDPATGQAEPKALLATPGFDAQVAMVFDHRAGQLLGLRYLAEQPGTVWLDEGMAKVQARIDERLPGLVNLVQPAECHCSRWLVVTSQSDRQPPVYFLYDTQDDRLEPLGRRQPRVDARQMRPTTLTRIAARDGLGLPVYLTAPEGKGPWPAVVLVHGGPWLRGRSLSWEAEAQFLASRGYLVIEPEFRGSTGYGFRLFQAGWKQWGLKMQDDLDDAARWAVDQGLADPARLCAVGGSYGGYAVLMALSREPAVYRCGVAAMAPTDLDLMYGSHDSDASPVALRYGLPVLMGDRRADAAQLEAASPVRLADRIRRPLLLVHGAKDQRVPIEHGRRLRDALQAARQPVQWVEYEDEGHGFGKPAHLMDHWTRVEQFLARHLALQPAGSTP